MHNEKAPVPSERESPIDRLTRMLFGRPATRSIDQTTPDTTMDDNTYQRVADALLKDTETAGYIDIRGDMLLMTGERYADQNGSSGAEESPFWLLPDDADPIPINNSDDLATELADIEYSLLDAALFYQTEAVEALIDGGADLEACDPYGVTPLMITSVPDIKKMLCEAGAQVDARDIDGMTALQRAAKNDDPKSIQVLLDAGADVNAQTNYGMTALHYAVLPEDFSLVDRPIAAKQNAPQSIRMLLAAGAQVDARDETGDTALHVAAECDDPESVSVLLDAGADSTLVNRRGERAEEVAQGKAKDILTAERERGILRQVVGLNDTEEPVQRSRRM